MCSRYIRQPGRRDWKVKYPSLFDLREPQTASIIDNRKFLAGFSLSVGLDNRWKLL